MKQRLFTFLLILYGHFAAAADTEPSEFRSFTNKQGKEVDARILSISEEKT
ncbi:hypothetical protein N9B73_08980 [Verrucomicrobiales bacterium]|nr:hypothetical protein [Verrucomicrobiales bacterium]